MKTLTGEQLSFYKAEGYIHLKGVVPGRIIDTMKGVLGDWVEGLVQKWRQEGLIKDTRPELDFWHRLALLWEDAGRPPYPRSPRKQVVEARTHAVLGDPALVDIAADLLETEEVSAHGVFNVRAKLPSQDWTNTPWHQDAQYAGISPHVHVPTFWFPLQDVDESYSCLGVLPRYHKGKLYKPHEDETGFVAISPDERKSFVSQPVPMDVGDLLCFTSLTPHHAYPNKKDKVRWSMDIRYMSTEHITPDEEQENIGFVARSPHDPGRVETFEEWYAKGWADRGW